MSNSCFAHEYAATFAAPRSPDAGATAFPLKRFAHPQSFTHSSASSGRSTPPSHAASPHVLLLGSMSGASSESNEQPPARHWKLHIRFTHNPYGFNAPKRGVAYPGQVPYKTSDALRLVLGSMPGDFVLNTCGGTPQPKDFLGATCVKVCFDCLLAELAEANQVDLELAWAATNNNAAGGDRSLLATFVVGQTGYTAPLEVARAVLWRLCPGVAVIPLTAHNGKGSAKRTLTGLNHSSARRCDLPTLIAACHQRAYYDRDGVWIAKNLEGVRAIAIFELTMRHYKNQLPTGRPMAPMTVEAARSNLTGA